MDVLTTPHSDTAPMPRPRAIITMWLFEAVLVAALVVVLVHLSELRHLSALLSGIRPEWLIVAAMLQSLTYVCTASVWRTALMHEGTPCERRTLVKMAFVMLFANQAVPTAGLSGAAVAVRGLLRRHVPANVAVAALFVGMVTGYATYAVAVTVGILVLGVYHEVSPSLLLGGAAFALTALLVPAAVIWYRESLRPRFRETLNRVPIISAVLDAVATAPVTMLRDRRLWRRLVVIQAAEILLDAATLFVILGATGTHLSAGAVFGTFVMASAVAEAAPIPSGLGTFEAALVGLLHLVGVSATQGIAAALIFRGFALWVPMLPGLWFARQELSSV